MSTEKIDVLKVMRVAQAYCYDAGATSAAANMKQAAAVVAELIEALGDFEGMGEPCTIGASAKLRRLRDAYMRVGGAA